MLGLGCGMFRVCVVSGLSWTRTLLTTIAAMVALQFVTIAAHQRSAGSSELQFEVASVKPNKSGSNRVNFTPQPGGRFTATNVSVMDLLAVAYGEELPFP